METRKTIEERRSIRAFKNEIIPKSLILDILECATLAPSAKNRQPWYFVVLEGDVKNQIANKMIKYTEEITKLIDQSELELNSAISIGYPNQQPKARPRKKLEEIIKWI